MEWILEHRAPFDGVKGIAVFQAAVKLLNQRAFSRTNRPHEIQDLAALFPFERGGVKVAHDLGNGLFDSEELIRKEIVDFDGLIFIKTPDMGIAAVLDIPDTDLHNHVVQPSMGELGDGRICLDLVQIPQQVAAPGSRLMKVTVILNELFKILVIVHSSVLPFRN